MCQAAGRGSGVFIDPPQVRTRYRVCSTEDTGNRSSGKMTAPPSGGRQWRKTGECEKAPHVMKSLMRKNNLDSQVPHAQ